MLKNLQQMHLKLLQNESLNIGNKIPNKITKVLKNSQQHNLETVTNENDKETPKERYISLEERQKITDNLRSIIIV